jgi:hypothetical protein
LSDFRYFHNGILNGVAVWAILLNNISFRKFMNR